MMHEKQLEFSSITVSFFCHATEDLERILRDVSDGLGLEQSDMDCINIEGHYGNKITSIGTHVIGEKTHQVAEKLISSLSARAKLTILNQLERAMDEHDSLYIRLDRQSLHGRIEVADDEPIRVKLKPKMRLADRAMTMRAYAEMLR